MTGPAAEVLAAGLELADMHREANNELRRHRPDRNGVCEGCGEEYPCSEEWATIKAITVIESHWRRAGLDLKAIRDAQERAATAAAGDERQETR